MFTVTTPTKTQCLQTSRFYRINNNNDCSKYYLCLDGDVFEFQCTDGLVFDVDRQICDVKERVRNCANAVAAYNRTQQQQQTCADGMTLPAQYFCDGSEDCADGSDEVGCDARVDPFQVGACDLTQCQLPECFCSKDGEWCAVNVRLG